MSGLNVHVDHPEHLQLTVVAGLGSILPVSKNFAIICNTVGDRWPRKFHLRLVFHVFITFIRKWDSTTNMLILGKRHDWHNIMDWMPNQDKCMSWSFNYILLVTLGAVLPPTFQTWHKICLPMSSAFFILGLCPLWNTLYYGASSLCLQHNKE